MSDGQLGRDLRLTDKDLGSDLSTTISGDLDLVDEEYNLGQAIINRLRTREGELADLGHASYGSRLYELIGEPNNEKTRDQVRTAARECISQEPRVSEVIAINVAASRDNLNQIDVSISVMPIGRSTVLNIVYPFYLEVA
jgi:phage baseplate assembly protein W